MRTDILNITIKQLFNARLHFGKKKQFIHKNVIYYVLGTRHNISILNLEKLLYNLRIIFSAIVEITSQRGVFFLIGGFKNLLLENILIKFFDKYNTLGNNFYITGITTGKWVNGVFSNWQIVYKLIQNLKKLSFKNTAHNASLTNLKQIKTLNNKIIPDLVLMFQYDADAINEIKSLNIPILGIIDSDKDPHNLLYSLIGNANNFESIYFFCQLIEEAIKLGQLEEQEKFLYYFTNKIKQTINK